MATDRPDLVTEQQPPTPNDKPAIWDLVIEDMRARDAEGRRRYGTPLQANNGRDPLVDAYQELLDGAVYIRQEIEERRAEVRRLREALRVAMTRWAHEVPDIYEQPYAGEWKIDELFSELSSERTGGNVDSDWAECRAALEGR